MLDKFAEEWKKTVDDMVKKLGEQYENLVKLIVSDLNKRKVEITGEINKLNKVMAEREEGDKLATAAYLKRLKDFDAKITEQKKIIEENDRLYKEVAIRQDILEQIEGREKAVIKKETELEDKELEVKARQMDINEKTSSIRRVLDKAKQI